MPPYPRRREIKDAGRKIGGIPVVWVESVGSDGVGSSGWHPLTWGQRPLKNGSAALGDWPQLAAAVGGFTGWKPVLRFHCIR
ncbi:MAG: hypothetical protein AAFP92_01095 [Bacteroidota bacterium]